MNVNYEPNAYGGLQARPYAQFAETSFSWLNIERLAIDEALVDHYKRPDNLQVLDIGCGGGRVIKHLIARGIPAEAITGLDPSVDMLAIAAEEVPQTVGLVESSASEMPFADESFNLVVANMVLHAMDDREAEDAIRRIAEVLAPGGDFLLIDSVPDSESPKQAWQTKRSPWGMLLNVFDHDIEALLNEVAPAHRLTNISFKQLEVNEAGRAADLGEYTRYSSSNFRFAAMLHKSDDVAEADPDHEPAL